MMQPVAFVHMTVRHARIVPLKTSSGKFFVMKVLLSGAPGARASVAAQSLGDTAPIRRPPVCAQERDEQQHDE
jgi:hypothetical protein